MRGCSSSHNLPEESQKSLSAQFIDRHSNLVDLESLSSSFSSTEMVDHTDIG